MKRRRKQLLVRNKDGKFFVGYWDGNKGTEQDFRCFGIRYTQADADKLVQQVLKAHPKEYK